MHAANKNLSGTDFHASPKGVRRKDASNKKSLSAKLNQRRQDHLYRSRRVIAGMQGPELQVDGRCLLSFCSNDYLGLAAHPEVIAAMQRGALQYGVGSGAAHLVVGHSTAHHALEEELANFTGRSRALLFSTGYMANMGVISALLRRGDRVFEDRLNHASLIDGGILSRARLKRYAHGDATDLAKQLKQGQSDALIVTDSIFSMDGDIAPLTELVAVARQGDAQLMVDDAHGLGVLGVQGKGSLSHFDLSQDDVPILMGTLGKAFGTFGAFVAGSEELIETLIQQARTYIYTTALPPAIAEATRTSLRIVCEDEWRRERLRTLVQNFRTGAEQLGLPLMASTTPIQPLLAGSSKQALAWSQQLEQQGILVSAIRPPTVAEGTARLRITFSATHTDAHLERLLNALAELKPELPS